MESSEVLYMSFGRLSAKESPHELHMNSMQTL